MQARGAGEPSQDTSQLTKVSLVSRARPSLYFCYRYVNECHFQAGLSLTVTGVGDIENPPLHPDGNPHMAPFSVCAPSVPRVTTTPPWYPTIDKTNSRIVGEWKHGRLC